MCIFFFKESKPPPYQFNYLISFTFETLGFFYQLIFCHAAALSCEKFNQGHITATSKANTQGS